ncbi:MAG: hypothetical protein HOC34_04185 [Candidatus Magasanikbacteria bacterium]|jgi:carboxypeptidase Taq|nr:hypothetical protein [Candidatus Magasanikbacteria bacterium]MBT4221082.1 hypothetical protein [Candidatus Magasanikbacteria bacterium]MBT4350574.1 hypothetical protein [Candidatus Magasanikbacteria bacterium]MBT4542127.1 hypothetical protein [Candidatus Magasanikbacteria bacterium]MBT6253249.1 hypothetical protein [Candidatus Magasanikbacteria bacterium]
MLYTRGKNQRQEDRAMTMSKQQQAFVAWLATVKQIWCLEGLKGELEWQMATTDHQHPGEYFASKTAEISGRQQVLWRSEEFRADALRLLANPGDLSEMQMGIIRATLRESQLPRTLPMKLVRQTVHAGMVGQSAWEEAGKDGRRTMEHLGGHLKKIVELQRMKGLAADPDDPYAGLARTQEPGLPSTKWLLDILEDLHRDLQPLVEEAVAFPDLGEIPALNKPHEANAFRLFTMGCLNRMGLEVDKLEIAQSSHPFCAPIAAPDDVRISIPLEYEKWWRLLLPGLHEAAHARYEQGFLPEWKYTPGARPASTGLHESIARFYECRVGRSLPFLELMLDMMGDMFPELKEWSPEKLYSALNRCTRQTVRVQADELTYNSHILLRVRIYQELIEGRLEVEDFSARWNELSLHYLGVEPESDALGCLRDPHPFMGIGYYGTYGIGNMVAAMFWREIEGVHPNIEVEIRKGNFEGLNRWLQTNIFCKGGVSTGFQLVEDVLGRPVGPYDLIQVMREHVAQLNRAY